MCTPERTATEATAATTQALQAAQAAAHAQHRDPHPTQDTLDVQGRNLADVLDALAELTATLTEQVRHYSDDRLLADDAGADPTERLAIAAGNLAQLRQSLTKAHQHTDDYRNALDHLSVTVDLTTP